MLLIHPPVVRSCEPPLGIARLAALLRAHGVAVRSVDLCAEGLDWMLGSGPEDAGAEASGGAAGHDAAGDTWTRRALRGRERNLQALREPAGYANAERYRRAVSDLQRALGAVSEHRSASVTVSLADYADRELSPLRKADLTAAAVRFAENTFFPFFSARLEAVLSEFPAAEIGISVNFLSQALCAFAIAGWLKAAHPEKRIVLGGGLMTSWVAQGRIVPGENFGGLISAVIPGDGEAGLLAFLGVERRFPLPAPDFSDFSSTRYFAPSPIVPFNFSYGCPWRRCTFCPEKAEGGAYRSFRAEEAAHQIRSLAEASGAGLIHFTDNEVSPAHLRALARTPPPAPWYGFARFSKELLDAAFCRALAASGCRMLQLGLESGDQAVLDAMDKGTRIDEIERMLGNLKDAGIGVYAYVLFGTPSEDRRAAEATRDFVARNADRIDFLNIAVFNLPAASEEASRLRTRAFYDGDLSLYAEFEHPDGWNRDAVRSFLRREFEADPRIRPIVRGNPPVFTSSHAPFFLR